MPSDPRVPALTRQHREIALRCLLPTIADSTLAKTVDEWEPGDWVPGFLAQADRIVAALDRERQAGREEVAPLLVALMGGRGWRQRYECGHGVKVFGEACTEACPLAPVREFFYQRARSGEPAHGPEVQTRG